MNRRDWALRAIAAWLGVCAASLLYGFSRAVDPDDSWTFALAFSIVTGAAFAAGLFLATFARDRGPLARAVVVAAMLPPAAVLALSVYEGVDRLRSGGPPMSPLVFATCVIGLAAHACAAWTLWRAPGPAAPRRGRRRP
jgi:hypothetical protein